MIGVFTPAYEYVDGQLSEFLGSRLADVISEVDGPLRVALVLYFVLYGFAILRGSISEPLMDGAQRAVKLSFIYVVATTAAYSQTVTEPIFTVLPNGLASAIAGADAPSIGHAFDDFLGRGFDLASRTAQSASVTDPGPYLVALLIYAATVITSGLGFGITIISKVALALLIALGPIFIACSVFEATRRFFFGWLAQCINYIVLFVLIITVLQLVLDLVVQQWGAIESQAIPSSGGLLFTAFSILGAVFFLHTPAIASGIAGGRRDGYSGLRRAGGFASGAVSSTASKAAAAVGRSRPSSRSNHGKTGGSIRHSRPRLPASRAA
jgi:type IV secretion system protein VirB6